jgi:hypothetical protein
VSYFNERVDALAKACSADVVGMLMWTDLSGQWWIAPLGSSAPDPDRALPPEWVPVKRLRRDDL